MKNCPFCNEKIRTHAKKCRYCHEWLKPQKGASNVKQPQDKVLLRFFFSPVGRLNRAKFLVGTLLIVIISISFFLNLADTKAISDVSKDWLAWIGLILILYVQTILYIKRFHDLNWSGWNVVGLLIPLVDIYLLIYLIFIRGSSGKNKYGLDPLSGTT